MKIHPAIQTLSQLITVDREKYEPALKIMEQGFQDMHVSDITEADYDWLYEECMKAVSSEDEDRQYNALKLLSYISTSDRIIFGYFGDITEMIVSNARGGVRRIYKPNLLLGEHLDEVFRDYTHRMSEPEKHSELVGVIYPDMKTSMMLMYFSLQSLEEEIEGKLEEDCADLSTEFGVVAACDTKNHQLRHVRDLLEMLHRGPLEKIFYDDEVPAKTSSLDEELEITGRYVDKESKD